MKLKLKSKLKLKLRPVDGMTYRGTVYWRCEPCGINDGQIGVDIVGGVPYTKAYVALRHVSNPERVKVGTRGTVFDSKYPTRFVPDPPKLRLKS